MRKIFAAVAAVVLLAACGSNTAAKVHIPEPEIHLEQLSSAPGVAAHVTGGIPINFRMSVTNTAKIPVTLKRVNVTSQGSGGYNVPNTAVNNQSTLGRITRTDPSSGDPRILQFGLKFVF